MTKNIYTIPSGAAFVDALAEGLWRQVNGDSLKLVDYLILLPTRRSCRHLREAFLRHVGGQAALLPRMRPLGDVDEDEFDFAVDQDLNLTIPPAISSLRRQLLLTQLIRAKDKGVPLEQATRLAEALARFLDQVQIAGCDLSKLDQLVQEKDLAKHWQQTVAFLEILTETWPKILTEEGCIDPADRRNRVLQFQASAWRAKPPTYSVIAAGSTGTIPVTALLLDVIATLPSGAVVLPGLDQTSDEEVWQAVDETHPQFSMKQLLEAFGIKRTEVKQWNKTVHSVPRLDLLRESMRPAEVTDEWGRVLTSRISVAALKGLSRIELDHPQEEAQAIALMMRAAMEQSNKTAALVTSDRMLAVRVSAALARWGIEVNDSAGVSLADQPVGSFLLDVVAAAAPQAGAVDYLSLLKHPLTACGLSLIDCRSRARQLEIKVWRSEKAEPSDWLDQIKRWLQPLSVSWHESLPLIDWLRIHVQLAEQFASSDEVSGSVRLWQGEAGLAAAAWFDSWQNASDGFPHLTGEEYGRLFATLLRGQSVRRSYGQHPRLSILGLLEARLIQADLIILGGLNEGSWPPEAEIDPWMSRPMKKSFGLPLPERRIGLSAHDFVQLASAPEVILTRAKRAGNAPTVPSRFLLRLETVLQALNWGEKLVPHEPWSQWVRLLDEPDAIIPCTAPAPRPPRHLRPQQLSVTEISTWRRNPYAIYAKHILKLKKLLPLDAEIDATDYGITIHKALDIFVKKYPDTLPDNALEELFGIAREVFSSYAEHPKAKVFWWPRFERLAGWFVDNERHRRQSGIKIVQAEAQGQVMLGSFCLRGRADRLDKMPDGKLAIVDYKTGHVPSQATVRAGYEPQLPLLALIASRGGFADVGAPHLGELSYWKLNGGREIADIQIINGDPAQLAHEAGLGLERLIGLFADPATPYQAVPKPQFAPTFNDYAHLARLAEWGRMEETE
jgi:ATP-dependent helicase/nuclease subunit B